MDCAWNFSAIEIERITFRAADRKQNETLEAVVVFRRKQFVTTNEKMKRAILTIAKNSHAHHGFGATEIARSPAHQAAHGI